MRFLPCGFLLRSSVGVFVLSARRASITCVWTDGGGESSEGRESDDSPEVFATLMFQLPSDLDVEGGVFKVFDPSLPPPLPPGPFAGAAGAPAAAAAAATVYNGGTNGGGHVAFSGRPRAALS